MQVFQYTGTDAKGQRISNVIEAADRRSALRLLQAKGITPIAVKSKATAPAAGGRVRSVPASTTASKEAKKRQRVTERHASTKGVKGSETLGLKLAKRLLDLHSGGMSLGDAIYLLSQRLNEPKLKRITVLIWGQLREGRSFAKSVEQIPNLFPRAMLPLFEAGEASGDMKAILRNCIEFIEERRALRKQILSSLSYPAVLICLVLVILIGFMYFLVPTIQAMIESMGGQMNFFTQTLISFSHFLLTGGPFILLLLTLLGVLLVQWRRSAQGRLITDRWVLKLPLIGLIVESSAMYQISNLMTTLMESGINTSENLKLSERTIQNRWLKQKFGNARTMIIEGASFSVAFKQHELYTDASIDVLTVGENTGSLERGLREITRSVRSLLDEKLKLLTVLISSGAMATAFIMVMFAALGMVLSVLEVSQTISMR